MSDYLDLNNEELLKDFFSEAEQQVEKLESNILVIENDPSNHEAIDEIFRAAHTLKGGSATVEMHELAGFTHVVEDLLDALRSNTIHISEAVVDMLLSAIDIIKAMLDARSHGSIYDENVEPIKEALKAFLPEKAAKKVSSKSAPKSAAPIKETTVSQQKEDSAPQDGASDLSEYELLELKEACLSGEVLWKVNVDFDESNPMNSVGGIQVFATLKECGSILKTVPDFDSLFSDEFYPQVIYYMSSKAEAATLERASSITDVTLETNAFKVIASQSSQKSSASESVAPERQDTTAQKVVKTAPVQQLAGSEDTDVQGALSAVAKVSSGDTKKTSGSSAHAGGSVLRVDSKRIDYLLNLVSETVITKASFNQAAMQFGELHGQLVVTENEYKERIRSLFEQLPVYLEQIQNGTSIKEIKDVMNEEYGSLFIAFDSFETSFKNVVGKFRSASQNLGRIAGELQEGVMKIRMVPISQIFSRFPRLVRDLSRELDKKINLVIEGEDTELDKSVVEDLLDPIMHCVRNSLDHGIEHPSDRIAKDKNEEGVLLLKASNEGNMIVIDIIDDGKGIDVERVRAKAIERGIIHPNKILSDQDAFQLIFEAGFSTADKITNVSGRGVGLDVVKTQIEKLNGSVTVSSERDKGTKFSIRLPLTLAIIQGLLVQVGKEVYSVPIVSVIESHRVRMDEITTIDNYEVLNVRNEVISVLRLSRLFGIKTKDDPEYNFIVIVGSAEKKIGVMVDKLIGEEDVVIKPLRDQFTVSPGIAGASILGDGSVSLIIDVTQLLELGMKQELQARQDREASVW